MTWKKQGSVSRFQPIFMTVVLSVVVCKPSTGPCNTLRNDGCNEKYIRFHYFQLFLTFYVSQTSKPKWDQHALLQAEKDGFLLARSRPGYHSIAVKSFFSWMSTTI